MRNGVFDGARRGRRNRRLLPGWLVIMALSGIAANAHASELREQTEDQTATAVPRQVASGPPLISKSRRGDGSYRFNARFRGFHGDVLSIDFEMPAAWRQEKPAFGISRAELDAIAERCAATPGCDRRARFRDYFHARGMGLRALHNGHSQLFVDVPAVVARNRDRVAPLAAALRDLAVRRGKQPQWTLEAALALVQSGIAYGRPGEIEGGRRILGFFPPPRTLARGYGDCDSKSALLAALLQNLTDAPIIGVDLPDHYLLGIAGVPRLGQAWIEYLGRPYVLVEAAGPALRRPGDVSKATRLALDNPATLRIHPMF